ncbi:MULTISPECIES: hypothetical protein [Bacillales]|uniref:Uncharacterized protein n=2 Tax=Bacillales TaxID=1385 RepID=A0A1M7KKE3_9BACL|nr:MULTISPECIES: hypothetical protein [Salinicoccus]MCD2137915.1 hypothetical protein [Salinicoccus halitifaciens]SHM65747.1 hypothetical protein SAMN02745189_02567 [Salinicoccus alkaliphilus DSM 16010]
MATRETGNAKHRINYVGICIVTGTAFGISLGGMFDSTILGMVTGSGLGTVVGYLYNSKN